MRTPLPPGGRGTPGGSTPRSRGSTPPSPARSAAGSLADALMVEEVYDDDGPSNLGHPLFDLMHQDFFLPTLYGLMGLREYKSWANYAMSCDVRCGPQV